MLYPLKFIPVYKNYIWGGRNLEKLGKELPEGIVAESWELSCHPDGESIISNGCYSGKSLSHFISEFGYEAVGTAVGVDPCWKPRDRFPLLVKLIDANDKLSVQVHPNDNYASLNEEDKSGKSEMWYIIWAKPGAKLVYGLKQGTTKEMFEAAIKNGYVENYLNYVEVIAGDAINIPAGLVHAIGAGIVLAEVQQNSNNTYRVYDYERIDKAGNKRPLHINKALDVINFDEMNKSNELFTSNKQNVFSALFGANKLNTREGRSPYIKNQIVSLVNNQYFNVELLSIQGQIKEVADGSRFYIYLFIDGEGVIEQPKSISDDIIKIKTGETVFIPAAMGNYTISGRFTAIRAYVP